MTTAQVALASAPVVPLRFLVAFNPRPSRTLADESCYLPMDAISEFGPVDSSRLRPTSELLQGYSFIQDGDVAYAKVTPCFENGKGMYAQNLPGGYAFATTEITVLQPRPGLEARYLAWVLQSDGFRSPGESLMSGAGGLKRVPEGYAASFRIPYPSISLQRAIADFLDRETAQIDAFIAKNEELIALLTERRSALVANAATKGLDPLADLKESGVEWLGRVPSHWRVSRLSRWFSVTLGKMLDETRNQASDGDILPYVRAANIRPRALDLTSVNEMPFTALERKKFQLQRGDLLVVEGGSIGMNAVLDEDMPGWGFQKTVNRVRPRRRDSTAFLGLQLDVMREAGGMEMLANVSTILHFTAEKLERTLIAMPPPEEQRDIIEHVAARAEPIDNALDRSRAAIDLARERRAALISAAVTGKIDVGVSA